MVSSIGARCFLSIEWFKASGYINHTKAFQVKYFFFFFSLSQLNPFGMCALLSFEIEMMVVQIGKRDVRVMWFMHLCLGLEHMRIWSLECGFVGFWS